MKKTILLLSASVAFSASLLANGSTITESTKSIENIYEKSSCLDSITPEAKAKKHAEYLAQQLNLSATQKQQVYNATLTKVNSMSSLKTKYNGDMKAAQSEITPIRSTYDTNLKTVLTPDQLKKYQQMIEARKVNAQQPRKINDYDPTILDSQW